MYIVNIPMPAITKSYISISYEDVSTIRKVLCLWYEDRNTRIAGTSTVRGIFLIKIGWTFPPSQLGQISPIANFSFLLVKFPPCQFGKISPMPILSNFAHDSFVKFSPCQLGQISPMIALSNFPHVSFVKFLPCQLSQISPMSALLNFLHVLAK